MIPWFWAIPLKYEARETGENDRKIICSQVVGESDRGHKFIVSAESGWKHQQVLHQVHISMRKNK